MGLVRSDSNPSTVRYCFSLCLPLSTTWRIPGTVMEVSAMFVEMMTLRVFFVGAGWKTRCWRGAARAAKSGSGKSCEFGALEQILDGKDRTHLGNSWVHAGSVLGHQSFQRFHCVLAGQEDEDVPG